jgi:hypothetical protein
MRRYPYSYDPSKNADIREKIRTKYAHLEKSSKEFLSDSGVLSLPNQNKQTNCLEVDTLRNLKFLNENNHKL